MTSLEYCIGILDSGFGGLSVTADLLKLTNCKLVYFADFENSPYGNQSKELVQSHVQKGVERLVQNGANAILLACNTATSVAVEYLRSRMKIPIFGMEPAIKPALQSSQGGKVLVLATELTLKEDKFLSLKNKVDPMNRVVPAPCPGLATLIDQGEFKNALEYARKVIENHSDESIQHVVLGCTHYIYLKPMLEEIFPSYSFYDGNLGTIRHVIQSLQIPMESKMNILELPKKIKSITFLYSGNLPKQSHMSWEEWIVFRHQSLPKIKELVFQ